MEAHSRQAQRPAAAGRSHAAAVGLPPAPAAPPHLPLDLLGAAEGYAHLARGRVPEQPGLRFGGGRMQNSWRMGTQPPGKWRRRRQGCLAGLSCVAALYTEVCEPPAYLRVGVLVVYKRHRIKH